MNEQISPDEKSSSWGSGIVATAAIFAAIAIVLVVYSSMTRNLPMQANDIQGKLSTPKTLSSDWKLMPLTGDATVSLSSLKGKVVFINRWATWCPPCVGEMPSIQKLVNHFQGDRDVVFAIASVEQDPSVVSSFIKKRAFEMPVYTELQNAPKELMTEGIPATFVLDRDGRLVFRFVGSREWDTADVIAMIESLKKQSPTGSASASATQGGE